MALGTQLVLNKCLGGNFFSRHPGSSIVDFASPEVPTFCPFSIPSSTLLGCWADTSRSGPGQSFPTV